MSTPIPTSTDFDFAAPEDKENNNESISSTSSTSSMSSISSPHPENAQQNTSAFSYLEGLNEPQKDAVLTQEGAVLVLAGAGTGKTRVLTTRLAHLLQTGKAYPSQILAVTFTNKAAQEMKERVSSLLGNMPVEGWWLGTFHSLAARMLRSHADLVGLSSNYTILDPDDQIRLLKQIMEEHNLDTKKWAPKSLIHVIDRWKDRGLTPDKVNHQDAQEFAEGKLPQIYEQYQNRLRGLNACDFGDLLMNMVKILQNPDNKELLEQYHKRFQYILVDEYQDTNTCQYLWLRLLAKGTGNICCVGDDDQSIYGWRGAEVGNILKFEKDFPGAKIIRLEENYRSTNHILKAASSIIAQNANRLGKELWSQAGEGDKITLHGLWDGPAEARWVGEEIEQLQRKNWNLNQVAILVRTSFQTREFEERFIQLGLPYKVLGGQRFYERQEIRDALAYLRIISQSADDLALERIINVPKRGIGDTTIKKLYAYARAQNCPLFDALCELSSTDEFTGKTQAALQKLVQDFERWKELAQTKHHAELASIVLEESGYIDMWQKDTNPQSSGRIDNLKELISGMQEYENLQSFLEHVALVLENQDASMGEHVSIMTLHNAKGLEFDAVFLPGWEEGLFPSQRTMDESGIKGLEEERRLAYVGITRARKKSFISFAGNRRIYGNWMSAIPSRFVEELPKDHVDIISETGMYGSQGRSQHWDSSGKNAGSEFDYNQNSFGSYGAPSSKTRTRMGAPQGHRNIARKTQTEDGLVFSTGERIFHEKFGYGTIIHIDGHKLDIAFEKSGQKRVMDSFVAKT